jgi:2-oxoglutarate ferredoxin oxidoreductase subunit gamma
MPSIIQVRLSGFGGQGIVLAGVLLGQAGVFDGKYASASNSYGAAARGSAARSEVVFSDGPIDFPHLIHADILMAMSQSGYDQDCQDVKAQSGLILYDHGLVTPRPELTIRQTGVPATEFAVKKLKDKQAANIVFLGALVEVTRIVSRGAIRKAIRTHVGERFLGLNLRALTLGLDLGRQANG